MKQLVISMILTGLLALLFSAGAVHASPDTPYSVTYYFNPAPSDAGCSAGVGSLPTVDPWEWSPPVYVGGPCPDDLMNTTYTGPDLMDVSVTYNITSTCGTQAEVGIDAFSLGNSPGFTCDGIGTDTWTSAPSYTVTTGQTINVDVGFSLTGNQTGGMFYGSITISGIDPPSSPQGVPEFPLGMLPLLVICVPVLILIKRRK